MSKTLEIFIDADACPVKEETYKVAFRYDVPVSVVANAPIRIPRHPLIKRITVNDHYDAADDYVAEHAHVNSIVITADILLAERCLKMDATVLGPKGTPFTKDSIGSALASRAIMSDLRAGGDAVGGPAPFQKADRSRFLSALDEAIVRLKRQG
ncbi:YaiI/YqxD family protein [Hyphococcus sp. DH-69]|uniref:YaiI/YqxD family protein n=1 Tax=Hyphococcus formosus TaxID=3143534 RepID=UPI00398B679E